MVAAVHLICPAGVDAVVDTARLGKRVAALVRDGGALVLLRAADARDDARIRYESVSVLKRATDTESLEWLRDQVVRGRLRTRVGTVLPMGKVREAHELVQRGGLHGRVVLSISDRSG